ncbi:MAG: hypothetical protein KKE52_12545 [Alphaproteobacteria bacterium]|nr:hypothetical protein [Alphaproteobacteria bacterium]
MNRLGHGPPLRGLTIAREIAASGLAVATYVVAALCAGWIVSILLAPLGYAWPRFAAEAAISTCLGMIASWRLTNLLFPDRSGRVIFAAFAGVVLLAVLAGRNGAPNWLHTAQALLLVGLAWGLFWPHRRPAR